MTLKLGPRPASDLLPANIALIIGDIRSRKVSAKPTGFAICNLDDLFL